MRKFKTSENKGTRSRTKKPEMTGNQKKVNVGGVKRAEIFIFFEDSNPYQCSSKG
jgi:hypothetical protein